MAFNTWVQDLEPVSPSALDLWFRPATGEKWQRNTAGDTWIFKGYADEAWDGTLPRSGGSMVAPILGSTGLAPLDNPDFTGTPKRSGIDLLTVADIEQLRREIYARLQSDILSFFGNTPNSSQTRANIAVLYGEEVVPYATLAAGFQIGLPTFDSDGVPATDEQVLFWSAGWTRFMLHDNVVSAADRHLELRLTEPRTATAVASTGGSSGDGWPDIGSYDFGISYICVAVR